MVSALEMSQSRADFAEQRVNVMQLLRDRGSEFVTGPSLKEFEPMGPHSGEHWGFTGEYVKRHFGVPADPKNPDSKYVETLRGASHLVLEKRLLELKRDAPGYYRVVASIFPADEGGDRDYDWLVEKARGNLDARRLLTRCNAGIDLLTRLCEHDELFVVFARARSVREEKKMEERNSEIADFYQAERDAGKSERSAALATRGEYGISEGRVRQIVELRRLEKGEPKRGRGRPRKRGA